MTAIPDNFELDLQSAMISHETGWLFASKYPECSFFQSHFQGIIKVKVQIRDECHD